MSISVGQRSSQLKLIRSQTCSNQVKVSARKNKSDLDYHCHTFPMLNDENQWSPPLCGIFWLIAIISIEAQFIWAIIELRRYPRSIPMQCIQHSLLMGKEAAIVRGAWYFIVASIPVPILPCLFCWKPYQLGFVRSSWWLPNLKKQKTVWTGWVLRILYHLSRKYYYTRFSCEFLLFFLQSCSGTMLQSSNLLLQGR